MTTYIGYRTEHTTTGRYYIGVKKCTTKSLDRFYLGGGRALRRAIKEHGKASFKREVVRTFSNRKDAEAWEDRMVTQAVVDDPMSFNETLGGKFAGKQSADVRKRIAVGHTGRKASEETKARQSAALKGKPLPPEHCRALSKALTGRTLSPKHKANISKGLKDAWDNGRRKAKR